MTETDAKILASGIVGIVIGLILGGIALLDGINVFRQEAVKRGCAEYSQTTGKWQWKSK